MTSPQPTNVMPLGWKASSNPDRCPWCDQPISHDKFEHIQARIAAQERERTAQFESRLKEQVTKEIAQARAAAKTQVDQATKRAADIVEKAARVAAEREAKARAEGQNAAEAASTRKLAAAEKAKQEAERQLANLKTSAQGELETRLRQQRESLEKAQAASLNIEKAKAFTESRKLEEKLAAMQRQLQQKTADQLGEGAEVDLFEALKAEFPDDRVRRVKKGTPGADILHEVVNHGRVCGLIAYDSKNRNAWKNDYVTKLRQDQLAAHADHAVLSTTVFPAGARQLHERDGVLVANPARVIALVHVLRRQVVQLNAQRLSNEARDEKSARLYEFITSDRCTQLLDEIDSLTGDLLEIDVKEVKAHEATWKNRGQLVRSVQRARSSLASEIEKIIGSEAVERSA